MMRRASIALAVVAIAACTKPTDGANADAAAPVTITASASVATTAPVEAAPTAAPVPPPAPKRIRTRPPHRRFDGGRRTRAGAWPEVRGGRHQVPSRRDRERNDPRVLAERPSPQAPCEHSSRISILLTLGANHVPNSIDPEKEIGPYVPKLLKRVKGIDCYWIAPPIWKPAQAKFNQWLSEHVAPCRFYDASQVEIPRRTDKIHPSEKGGEVWAEDFWKFFKGEGAFLESASGGGGEPRQPASARRPPRRLCRMRMTRIQGRKT